MHYWDAFLCTHGCCSKSFGKSTPHREAYRAHSSPNSPISPRLVKPPPLEGLPRHIVHQTIWDNAIPVPFGRLRFSRCVTSGRKTAFHALLAPDVWHQEESKTASVSKKWVVELEETCFGMVWMPAVYDLTLIRTEKGSSSNLVLSSYASLEDFNPKESL